MTAQKSLVISLYFALAFAIFPLFSFAQEHEQEHKSLQEAEEEFNATEMIMHHIGDSHEWHFFGEGESSVTLPLPVILYTEGGLVTFMSSEFHHDSTGHNVVEKDGMRFVNLHEDIYKLDAGAEAVEFDAEHHPLNASKPWDLSITKNVAAMFLTVILMLLFFTVGLARHHKKNEHAPRGFNNVLETLVLFVRDEIAIPQIGKKKYMTFMPFLLTVFFFIWITNLMGLLPGAANVTGNIAVTFSLALFTMLIMIFNGNKDFYKHTFWMPGIPTWVKPILAIVEGLGLLIKPAALMIRLFANITAGHIIILSLIGLIFILENAGIAGVSVPFALFITVLELLVAFLQAFIFTILSALFIGMAVEEHEHH